MNAWYFPQDGIQAPLLTNLVLPNADDLPSPPPQQAKVPLIASTVCIQLGAPESGEGVLPGRETPAVPKVAIHENCDTLCSKHYVRTPGQSAVVELIAESQGIQIALY